MSPLVASLADKIERAVQAQHLVDEGLFAESMAKLEAEYLELWRNARSVRRREDLHRLIVLMDRLKSDLKSVITTGKIELSLREKIWPM